MEKIIKKWEKTFKKKMTEAEKTMFQWGFAYGTDYMLDEQKKRSERVGE